MIKLPNARLSAATGAQLKIWQHEVDRAGDYAKQVATAKQKFARRTKSVTFADVRQTLERMCRGPRRCGYCEDSVADEIEHIKPKDLYPELVFAWSNYLYACGQCNGGKSNQFAVFTRAGTFKDVLRRRNDPITPPEKGEPVLINPRREDALQWLQLDLKSFCFAPRALPGSREFIRAEYTIEVLKLNSRSYLTTARKSAYENYRARLVEYIAKRDAGFPQTKLNRLKEGFRQESHPTVWAEMKRQRSTITELNNLFTQAPEALNW